MINEQISIPREYLATLLWYAKRGDIANSQRRLRHGLRHVPICSDPAHRDPDCHTCQAFDAAEHALATEQAD